MSRGRPPGFAMSAEHRVKVQNSNILNALSEHATGAREMSQTQVTAGLGLLRKCLPDLQAVELSTDPQKPLGIAWLNYPTTASSGSITSPEPNSSGSTAE